MFCDIVAQYWSVLHPAYIVSQWKEGLESWVKNRCQVCVRFDVGLWIQRQQAGEICTDGLRPAAEQFSSPADWWADTEDRDEILLTTG